MNTKSKTIPRVEITKLQTQIEGVKIKTSFEASEFCRKFYFDDINIFESFFIVLINQANITTGFAKLSQGGICGTIVDVRLLAHYAINCLAGGVILCHNHPSGNLRPSEADLKMTRKVQRALELLDVQVLDHIILTDTNYYSFADNGQL